MSIDLYMSTDNLIQLTGLVDNETGGYINDATVEMSLFKAAPQQRLWILTPNGVATAGTWTLTYQGAETAAIAYNAELWEIQAALEALSTILEGDIHVSGQPLDDGTGGVIIEFAESFSDVQAMTFDFTDITGPTNALSTIAKQTKRLFTGAVVDKGGGKVGLPVLRHGAAGGDYIRIEGTVNYNGEYTVDAATSTNEIVVTATYIAETMTSHESLYIGIENGTEISLAYEAASNGDYSGILPYNLGGVVEYEMINTTAGQIERGVYWLFVLAVKAGNYRLWRKECRTVFE